MHWIIKLSDIRISGQNVTSDFRYPIRYPRRQFLQVGYFLKSDIRHFLDIQSDSEKNVF